MRESLGPTTLANMLKMIISEAEFPILVVEGESDKFIVAQHLSSDIQVIPGNIGRDSILQVAESINTPKVYYLVDRDLDDALNGISPSENIIVSESHDIVMDLVFADPKYLERTVLALTRKARERSAESLPPSHELISGAFDLAWHLVPVRIANHNSRFGIKFREFPFGALKSTTPSWDELVRVATLKSGGNVTATEVLEAIEAEIDTARKYGRALVGDHDFFSSVSRVLRESGIKKITKTDVETTFLATVDCNLVAQTLWAKNLKSRMSARDLSAFDCPHLEDSTAAA